MCNRWPNTGIEQTDRTDKTISRSAFTW